MNAYLIQTRLPARTTDSGGYDNQGIQTITLVYTYTADTQMRFMLFTFIFIEILIDVKKLYGRKILQCLGGMWFLNSGEAESDLRQQYVRVCT